MEEYTVIKHHGILGMKWGVRRRPDQLGHKPSTKIPPSTKSGGNKKTSKKDQRQEEAKNRRLRDTINSRSKGQQEAAKPKVIRKDETEKTKNEKGKTPSISKMSEAELKSMISRLELETKYMRLVKERTPPSRVQKAVSNILVDVGTTQIKRLLNKSIVSLTDGSDKPKKKSS